MMLIFKILKIRENIIAVKLVFFSQHNKVTEEVIVFL